MSMIKFSNPGFELLHFNPALGYPRTVAFKIPACLEVGNSPILPSVNGKNMGNVIIHNRIWMDLGAPYFQTNLGSLVLCCLSSSICW